MTNAADQLAEILEELRDKTPATPVAIIRALATEYKVTPVEMLTLIGGLAHKTDQMFQELDHAGEPIGHFREARAAWLSAPFLYEVGWMPSANIDADSIIPSHHLSLLRAFAIQYDSTSRMPKPNQAALDAFILELEPIADFVKSLALSDEMKSLILLKIENLATLISNNDVSFEVIITKLGEILGLLVILAGSDVLSEEESATLWDKVKTFTAKFGQDMTVNVLSGAIVSGGMGAIGM